MNTNLITPPPFFLACKESRVESPVSLYGCFYLGPFNSGQSLTVANALRRTLLSELTGIAISSVQIEGAMHEYSTLNGVRESVLDIVLNLKEVILKVQAGNCLSSFNSSSEANLSLALAPHVALPANSFPSSKEAREGARQALGECEQTEGQELGASKDSSGEATSYPPLPLKFGIDMVQEDTLLLKNPQIGYLKARGPGIVRARDLKLPISIQCVNPDHYLFTLCEDGEIDIKFRIYQGKNSILNSRSLHTKKIDSYGKDNSFSTQNWKPKSQTWKKQLEHTKSLLSKDFTSFASPMATQKDAIGGKGNKSMPFVKNSNFISLDSIFTPVNQVNYIIEENNSSNHTIILEIWTNGSIHPKQALFIAVKQLIKLFSRLETFRIVDSSLMEKTACSNPLQKNADIGSMYLSKKTNDPLLLELKAEKTNSVVLSAKRTEQNFLPKQNEQKDQRHFKKSLNEKKFLLLDIGTLNISLRSYICLKRANIHTIGKLIQFSKKELLQIKSFGKRSLEEIEKSLKQNNLYLK